MNEKLTQKPSIIIQIYKQNGRTVEDTANYHALRHSALLTNKSLVAHGTDPGAANYKQIGVSGTWHAKPVLTSVEGKKLVEGRKCGTRRWRGSRRIDMPWIGFLMPLVERFFSTLGRILFYLDARFRFLSNCGGPLIGADR